MGPYWAMAGAYGRVMADNVPIWAHRRPWAIYGPFMCHIWPIYVPFIGHLWAIYGPSMGHFYGSSMGPFMGHRWDIMAPYGPMTP